MALPTLYRRRPLTPAVEEPFLPLERMMQRFFEDMPEQASLEAYPVDIREEDDQLVVDAELPGFEKRDVDVSLDEGVLNITAERSSEPPKGTSHLRERRFHRVQRSLPLPTNVDPESVDAKLDQGVLHLTAKKSETEHRRKITVS